MLQLRVQHFCLSMQNNLKTIGIVFAGVMLVAVGALAYLGLAAKDPATGAPTSQSFINIQPFRDSAFSLGTSTRVWNDLHVNLASTSVISASDGVSTTTISGNATSTFPSGVSISGGGLSVGTIVSCDTVDTDASGNFICGSDDTGAVSARDHGKVLALAHDLQQLTPTTTVDLQLPRSLFASSTIVTDATLDVKGTATSTFAGGIDLSAAVVDSHVGYSIANVSVLTGTTLEAAVVNSSLTSVGTLAGLTVSGNIVMADNSVTGIDTLTFTDTTGTVAGIQNGNLVDKSAAETVSGLWAFTNIGTSTFSGNIDVVGNIRARSALIAEVNAVANGLLTVGSINATSTATSTFTGGISAGGLASSEGLTISGGGMKIGASDFIVTDAGNVGIGTTSPSAILAVEKSTSGGTTDFIFKNSANTTHSHSSLTIQAGGPSAGDVYTFYDSQRATTWVSGIDISDSSKFKINTGSLPGAGSEFVIDTSGNVGIATTSPTALLSVEMGASGFPFWIGDSGTTSPALMVDGAGKIAIGAATTSSSALVRISDGAGDGVNAAGLTQLFVEGSTHAGITIAGGQTSLGFLAFSAGNDATEGAISYNWNLRTLKFHAAAGVKMTLDGATGNFGIGTTTPGGLLAVENTGTGLSFIVGDAANDTTPFIVDNAGKVGIGSLTPEALLELDGTSNLSVRFEENNTVRGLIAIDSGGEFIGGTADNDMVVLSSSNLLFASGGGNERMRIASGGNVGIGTTSPTSDLSLHGANTTLLIKSTATSGQSDIKLDSDSSSGGGSVIVFQEDGVGKGTISYRTTQEDVAIRTGGIGTNSIRLTVASNGNIFAEDLETNTTIQDDLCWDSGTGELEVNTSNDCNSSSSLRYKENISKLAYGIEEVLQLNPVSFNYLPEYAPSLDDQNKKIGFIAEEVKLVIPEVIQYDKENLPSAIDYGNLTALLVSAVQDIWDKVTGNDERITELESQVADLEARLEKLEND